MRTHIHITLATLSLLVLSCRGTVEPTPEKTFGGKKTTLEAVLEESIVTKTGFDPDTGRLYWREGDELSVFYRTEQARFECSSTSGTFEGTIPEIAGVSEAEAAVSGFVKALYPYREDNRCDGKTISALLPGVQQAREGGFEEDLLLCAAGGSALDRTLSFVNLCGGIRFQVALDGITKITLKGNNDEALAGDLQVGFDAAGKPNVQTTSEAVRTITLKCPEGFRQGVWYYMVSLPVKFSKGFTIGFETEGATYMKSRDEEFEIRRATFHSMVFSAEDIDPDKGEIVIDDPGFRAYCLTHFDTDSDGILTREEALQVRSINVQEQILSGEIKSLEGLSAFPNLEILFADCEPRTTDSSGETLPPDRWDYHAGSLTGLDLRMNTNLKSVWCSGNRMTSLLLGKNSCLEELHCACNYIPELALDDMTGLKYLYAESNSLTAIDISGNTALEELAIDRNAIGKIDVSMAGKLRALTAAEGALSSITLAGNSSMEELVADSNAIGSIDLSGCTKLAVVSITNNRLTGITADALPSLTELMLSSNELEKASIKDCPALANLQLTDNRLTEIDLRSLSGLSKLILNGNSLTALDTGGNPELVTISCDRNRIESLDLSKNRNLKNLRCSENLIGKLDVSMLDYLSSLDCSPMNDSSGQNILSQLTIYKGQSIKNVTYNRNDKYIPAGTRIVEVGRVGTKSMKTCPEDVPERVFIPLRLRKEALERRHLHYLSDCKESQ